VRWHLFAAKEIRSIWCTTCAAAEKCVNCTWRDWVTRANYGAGGKAGREETSIRRAELAALREQINSHLDLADPNSPTVQKLVGALRDLNLDLADLFPPILRISESPRWRVS